MQYYFYLMIVVLTSCLANADVIQREKEFIDHDAKATDVLFWGEIETLSQWNQKGKSHFLGVDQHPQYTALIKGEVERDYPSLTDIEINSVLGEKLGREFLIYYNDKGEEYRLLQETKNFTPQSALIFEVKISEIVEQSEAEIIAKFNDSVGLLQKMDQPHTHVEVGTDFAHRLLEPMHSGHTIIDNLKPNEKLIFSAIRMEDYQCKIMSQLLDLATEVHGESVSELDGRPVLNIYSLSRIGQVTDDELGRYAEFFGFVPTAVFYQDMIFSSRFVKDVINIWAVQKVNENQTRLVGYSVLATTNKLQTAINLALTGPTPSVLGELVSNKASAAKDKVVEAADNVLDSLFGSGETAVSSSKDPSVSESRFPMIMTENVVDLNSDVLLSACRSGLTKGIPKYILDMFENIPKN
ncbi:MAG: hypothetical protein KDD34_06525 [Bdellovibrionales bacterium]|nr:hypothetical protein [Bdellovibrionales bacterium]